MPKPFYEITPADPPLPLTEREQNALTFIREYVRDEGRWPRYKTMKDRFGWSSSNSVTQTLKGLYRKGYIERRGRGKWVFRTGACPHCGQDIPSE